MPDNHKVLNSVFTWTGVATIGALLVVLAIVLMLSGCYASDKSALRSRAIYVNSSVKVIVDPDTGCHYLTTGDDTRAGITPRLLADGKQLCLLEDQK